MTDRAPGFLEKIRMCFFPWERIVLPMAAEAILDFQMDPLEGSTGLLVIEILRIERDKRDIFSLMFCVADRAVFAFISMIAPSFGYPHGNLLVADEAPGRLGLQVFIVAFAAIFKPWGILMGDAQFSRGIGNIECFLRP